MQIVKAFKGQDNSNSFDIISISCCAARFNSSESWTSKTYEHAYYYSTHNILNSFQSKSSFKELKIQKGSVKAVWVPAHNELTDEIAKTGLAHYISNAISIVTPLVSSENVTNGNELLLLLSLFFNLDDQDKRSTPHVALQAHFNAMNIIILLPQYFYADQMLVRLQ
ncbi:hypothetical protein FF38_06613 [Lucilia cuprina]|uniref:Uncharacterized protein n=1 Tax=Lucilia cuprina TaxID=7375 RepID=A0A0L0CJ10_LUCCU|nr:hypothetical protein FF38_06613 [Lucilia cuprina]